MACVGCGLDAGSWFMLGCEGLVRFEGDDGSTVGRWSWLVKVGVCC